MSHPLINPVHRFHIPVMGTGFTIDTPLKVARYGISSVVSLVDDVLIEQMRGWLSRKTGHPYEAIAADADDSRANRITAYLDLLDDLVHRQVERLRQSAFEKGNELTAYFEMLPESPLKSLYSSMQATADPARRAALQEDLRRHVRPGAIDVNIMTKLDRARVVKGMPAGPLFSDAMTALRGFARSKLESSVVLSAGMNRKLYGYLREFPDFFPDATGEMRKRIILKVSDFRSALIQGKLLARQGLWVSEYRIESGLNCGGHAFGGKGVLLGPVLEDFRTRRDELREDLSSMWSAALVELGRQTPATSPEIRVTVQGGIETAEEVALLNTRYGVDGTGWGSPFLFVPEVVNIDEMHLARLCEAGEDDVFLSDASPLGVPFWSLRSSDSEHERLERIADGKPGSACPKGFLVSDTEFTKAPICTASRAYQRRKLTALEGSEMTVVQREAEQNMVMAKACICHDLAGGATKPSGLDPSAHTAVCCGPNTVYFSRESSLREMIDHIYGRISLPVETTRPHMFLKELSLHLDSLRKELDKRRRGLVKSCGACDVRENLRAGVTHYHELATRLLDERRESFGQALTELQSELEQLIVDAELADATQG